MLKDLVELLLITPAPLWSCTIWAYINARFCFSWSFSALISSIPINISEFSLLLISLSFRFFDGGPASKWTALPCPTN